MAIQNYNTVAGRNLIRAEQEMLKRVETIQVLGQFGQFKEQPLNKTDTIVFRRLDPFNKTADGVPDINPTNFVGVEGTTPDTNTIGYTDVSVTLEQYIVLFKYSSKAALMYEDNIPQDMITQTGDVIAEILEKVAYGGIKSGSSVMYANGSTRAGVASVLTLDTLQRAARGLAKNRAKLVTEKIKPGPNFGTAAVDPSYIVFCDTDCVADIKAIDGFTRRVDYGTAIKPVHSREFGSVDEFRFVSSPLFEPYLAAGAAAGSYPTLKSVGGANLDVYPVCIMSADAWAHVSLKGHGGRSAISPTHIPHNKKTPGNPAGQFGFVGADVWYAFCRLNENWMTRIETAVSALG